MLWSALDFPSFPLLIIAEVAPFTPQRPWVTMRSTSFDAIVSSVSSTKVSLVSSAKGPSAVGDKMLSPIVRPPPHAQVFVSTSKRPSMIIVYAPTVLPYGTSITRTAKATLGASRLAMTARPIVSFHLTMP